MTPALAIAIFAIAIGGVFFLNVSDWQTTRDGTWHHHRSGWRRLGEDGEWQYRKKSAQERDRDILSKHW